MINESSLKSIFFGGFKKSFLDCLVDNDTISIALNQYLENKNGDNLLALKRSITDICARVCVKYSTERFLSENKTGQTLEYINFFCSTAIELISIKDIAGNDLVSNSGKKGSEKMTILERMVDAFKNKNESYSFTEYFLFRLFDKCLKSMREQNKSERRGGGLSGLSEDREYIPYRISVLLEQEESIKSVYELTDKELEGFVKKLQDKYSTADYKTLTVDIIKEAIMLSQDALHPYVNEEGEVMELGVDDRISSNPEEHLEMKESVGFDVKLTKTQRMCISALAMRSVVADSDILSDTMNESDIKRSFISISKKMSVQYGNDVYADEDIVKKINEYKVANGKLPATEQELVETIGVGKNAMTEAKKTFAHLIGRNDLVGSKKSR